MCAIYPSCRYRRADERASSKGVFDPYDQAGKLSIVMCTFLNHIYLNVLMIDGETMFTGH